jgi:hypothetical protein
MHNLIPFGVRPQGYPCMRGCCVDDSLPGRLVLLLAEHRSHPKCAILCPDRGWCLVPSLAPAGMRSLPSAPPTSCFPSIVLNRCHEVGTCCSSPLQRPSTQILSTFEESGQGCARSPGRFLGDPSVASKRAARLLSSVFPFLHSMIRSFHPSTFSPSALCSFGIPKLLCLQPQSSGLERTGGALPPALRAFAREPPTFPPSTTEGSARSAAFFSCPAGFSFYNFI